MTTACCRSDLEPELWLDDPEEEEDAQANVPPAAASAPPPPPVRHFANIGRLPAPDSAVLPQKTTADAKVNGERCNSIAHMTAQITM